MNRFRLLALSGLVCSVAIAGLAVLAVLFSPFGGDSTGAGDGAVKTAEQDSADSAADPSGVGEGIQVHGDWVIEVRNKDGSLAERREFKNALQPTGETFLVHILARQASPAVWAINLRDNEAGPPSPCEGGDVVGQIPHCVIGEPIASLMDTLEGVHFPTLTVSIPELDSELVLQGDFDAIADGAIEQVETHLCVKLPPSEPTCNSAQMVTGTTLGVPVDVLAGQQVLVTVRINFS